MSATEDRYQTLRRVMSGELSFAAAAEQHGVDEATVRGWSELLIFHVQSLDAARRAKRRWVLRGLVGAVAVSLALNAHAVWAQACPLLPGGLIAMCADQPAVADDLNRNFTTLVNRAVADEANTQRLTNKLGSADAGVVLQAPVQLASGCAANSVVSSRDASGNLTCRPVFGDLVANAGSYFQMQNNASGYATGDMIATSEGFCYLTQTAFEDLDAIGEVGGCEVVESNGRWLLRAYIQYGGATDADAYCSARCVRVR